MFSNRNETSNEKTEPEPACSKATWNRNEAMCPAQNRTTNRMKNTKLKDCMELSQANV